MQKGKEYRTVHMIPRLFFVLLVGRLDIRKVQRWRRCMLDMPQQIVELCQVDGEANGLAKYSELLDQKCVSIRRGCGVVLFCLYIRNINHKVLLAGLSGGGCRKVCIHIGFECIFSWTS